MKRGKCELCHALRDLQDSHYLPRGGYKRQRASGLANPNPVVISGGQAIQSSLQVRDYKFCTECEERFNIGGEAWILSKIPQSPAEPFWIHTVLDSAKLKATSAGRNLLFPQSVLPEVDLPKLIYFGISIFWRGTRMWTPVQGGRLPRIYLGRYEQATRRFLLGRGGLPSELAITVAVWPYKRVYPAAWVPCAWKAPGYRRYWFYYFGLIFVLSLGKKIPATVRRTCSYHSPEMFLTLSEEIGRHVRDVMSRNFQSADRSKIAGMLDEISALRSKKQSGSIPDQ